MMKFYLTSISVFLWFNCLLFLARNVQSQRTSLSLSSEVLSSRGKWMDWQTCPTTSFISGFDVKVLNLTNPSGREDSTGLASIVMECMQLTGQRASAFIFSDVDGISNKVSNGTHFLAMSGQIGIAAVDISYNYPLQGYCKGVAIGYQVMHLSEQVAVDNSASTNLRLLCSELKDNVPNYVEAYGEYKGDWGKELKCRQRQALCGLQTQSQAISLEEYDNIAINGIRVKCCDIPNPVEFCEPDDKWELIQECENVVSDSSFPCSFPREIGVSYNNKGNHLDEYELFESLAFSLDESAYYIYDALAKKFATNLGKSSETGYDWGEPSDEVFSSPKAVMIDYGLAKGYKAQIFQAVGKCNYFSVKTPKLKIEMSYGVFSFWHVL